MKYVFGLLFLAGAVHAQEYSLSVIYSEVEDINQASSVLELQSGQHEEKFSSLCAYHIIHREFVKAKDVCDQAVETEGTFAAYNNRGVLRAKLGDFNGALEDLDIVRVLPENQPMYLKRIARQDSRMIATSNHSVVKRLAREKPRFAVKGADVEDLQ